VDSIGQQRLCCDDRLNPPSTSRLNTASGSPRRGSSLRSAASEIPYDNALAETVIGLFKTEVIHRRGPWRSFDAVECATLVQ
jgi:hypothetical protein